MFLGKHQVWIYLLLFSVVQKRKKEIKEKRKQKEQIFTIPRKNNPTIQETKESQAFKKPHIFHNNLNVHHGVADERIMVDSISATCSLLHEQCYFSE